MDLHWEGGGIDGNVDGVKLRLKIALRPGGIVVTEFDAVADGGEVANLDLAAGPYESREALVDEAHASVRRWKASR